MLPRGPGKLAERCVQLLGEQPGLGRRGRHRVLEVGLERQATVRKAPKARQEAGGFGGAQACPLAPRFVKRALDRGLRVGPGHAGPGTRLAHRFPILSCGVKPASEQCPQEPAVGVDQLGHRVGKG